MIANTTRPNTIKRRLFAGALALALIGTGLTSLAVVSDSMVVNNSMATLSVSLSGSNDQVIFSDPLAVSWSFEAGSVIRINRLLSIKNTGNGSITIASSGWAWAGTGASSLTGAAFVISGALNGSAGAATLATCPASGGATVGTNYIKSGSTVAAPGTTGGFDLVIPAGGVADLCMSATPAVSVAVGATASQSITITGNAYL